MVRVLKGSHSFTCTPRVHPLTEWTIPAFAFPAEAGTHLPTPEGWKAELALSRPSSQRGSYANLIGFNGKLNGSKTVLETSSLEMNLAVYAKFVSINSKGQTRDQTEFCWTAVQPTPTVQAPLTIRTWAFAEGDAVAIMPDWAMRGTETSADAYGRTWYRSWLVARRRARGTTVPPHATSIAHCQHSLSSLMWSTTIGRSSCSLMTSFCPVLLPRPKPKLFSEGQGQGQGHENFSRPRPRRQVPRPRPKPRSYHPRRRLRPKPSWGVLEDPRGQGQATSYCTLFLMLLPFSNKPAIVHLVRVR